MKKANIKTLIFLSILIFLIGCSGQEMNLPQVSGLFQKNEPMTFETTELGSLQSSMNQATLAANSTDIKSLPFAILDANSKIHIDKTPNAATFSQESLLVTNYKITPEGSESFDFLSESADLFGRKDRRIGAIVYGTQKPSSAQAVKIKEWLLTQNKSLPAEKNSSYQEALLGFQREAGLSPDGQFGPKTAQVLAQNMAMIHIKELDNHIYYPKIPNHMVFIIPYDVFKKDEAKLSQGFQSLLAIGKLGLTADKFKSIAKQGEKYVMLVYFFDRVNPTFAINIGFSIAERQWDNRSTGGQKYYAKPGSWPVIVEEFTISDTLSNQLFVNIFLKESRFKFKCAGSHKLL